MARELGMDRFEPLSEDEGDGLATVTGFERYDNLPENFDFESWASAVKRQLLAALHKES